MREQCLKIHKVMAIIDLEAYSSICTLHLYKIRMYVCVLIDNSGAYSCLYVLFSFRD